MLDVASGYGRSAWVILACGLALACDRSSPDTAATHDATPDLGPPTQHRAVGATCTSPAVAVTSDATAPTPACGTDGDCAADQACACDVRCDPARSNMPANLCLFATCRTDADCGVGGFCSLSFVPANGACTGGLNGAAMGFFCHKPDDECRSDSDCAGRGPHANLCLYGNVGHWICSAGP